jgi:hypothetical protein
MPRLRSRVTYANVMSTFAAVVALGAGSAYAVTQLPAHSVGTKQLANSSVTGKKVKDGSLKAKDFKAGELPSGPRGLTGPKGDQGAPGDDGAPAGVYLGTVSNVTIPATPADTCFKGGLTEPGIKVGDTVLVVPDYGGTFPISISVVPGISTITGTITSQFCNNGALPVVATPNQTVALWRITGPTP